MGAEEKQSAGQLEFERLRDEIDGRTALQGRLVIGHLAAFATGIGFAANQPDVLLALAIASTFLWLFWLDHTEQIYKIALYIGSVLALSPTEHRRPSLGWERFLRLLDGQNEEALSTEFGCRLLVAKSEKARTKKEGPWVRRSSDIGWYITLMFGGAPLALLLVYTATSATKLDLYQLATWIGGLRLLGLAVGWALWFLVGREYLRFSESLKVIDATLATARQSPDPTGIRAPASGT